MNVTACPICGQRVLYTCYHDGDDVTSVEMPSEEAIKLLSEHITYLQDILESLPIEIARYQEELEELKFRDGETG